MSNQKFFRFPFGVAGDLNNIPDDPQGDGSISYNQGWGFDYERDPSTDPDAKNIQRDDMNGVLFDITNNIRQYQLFGVPEYVTAAQNGGTAPAYSKFARVRFDAVGDGTGWGVFESQVDNNTADPSDTAKWKPVTNINISDYYATKEEAEAGSDNTKLMTPLRTAEQLIKKLAPTGLGLAAGVKVTDLNSAAARLNVFFWADTNAANIPLAGSSYSGITFAVSDSELGQIVVNTRTGKMYSRSKFGSNTSGWSKWKLINGVPSAVVFATAGNFSWTVPAGVTQAKVTAIGGGGGGGGAQSSQNFNAAGGGGGAGGVAVKFLDVSALTTVTGVIGAGGAPSTIGTGSGSVGGTTTVGASIAATGGSGGNSAQSPAVAVSSVAAGQPGGVGTGGDMNFYGGGGQPGVSSQPTVQGGSVGPGHGGVSILSGAINYGAGGRGGFTTSGNTTVAGIAGADGAVIIEFLG